MKNSLSYVYYRIARMYYKWDGSVALRALFAVTAIQFMIPSSIVILLTKEFYGAALLSNHSNVLGGVSTLAMTLLCARNYLFFKGKYHEFRGKWDKEPDKLKLIHGALIVIALITSVLSVVVVGVL